MMTYLVLFRGINVGGNRVLPMATLRAACLALGWHDPQTYIQSGNLIVDAPAPAVEARTLLAHSLHAGLGWTPEIILCTPPAWREVAGANPFALEPDVEARALHLFVSVRTPAADAARELQAHATQGERAVLAGGGLWIDFGGLGPARSRLTPARIDKACGAPATGRNWTTVQRLTAMLDARLVGS